MLIAMYLMIPSSRSIDNVGCFPGVLWLYFSFKFVYFLTDRTRKGAAVSKVIRNIHRSYYLSGASGAFGEKYFFSVDSREFKITVDVWLSLDIMNWFSSVLL